MTADGGSNPDVETWDEARIALGRVADLIREKLGSYTEPGSNETIFPFCGSCGTGPASAR